MNTSPEQQVKALLLQRDYTRLLDLCERNSHFWKALWFYLYETDEYLRGSAIEGVARLMQRWWQGDHREKVREYIRRLLWSMNAESGGIGWSAPQTIAEIIAFIPELLEPYGSIMIGNTFEEPSLVKGGLWGIGRLGTRIEEAVTLFHHRILETFRSNDPETVGLAAWAMGEVGFMPALPYLEILKDRKELVRIYIEGNFYEKTLGQWALEALAKVRRQQNRHD